MQPPAAQLFARLLDGLDFCMVQCVFLCFPAVASQTTTAPTGTSPSSAAFCASLSAAFMYFSCSVINSSDFPEQTRFRLLKFFPRNKAAVAQSGEDIKLLDRRRRAVGQRHLIKLEVRNERVKRRKAVR